MTAFQAVFEFFSGTAGCNIAKYTVFSYAIKPWASFQYHPSFRNIKISSVRRKQLEYRGMNIQIECDSLLRNEIQRLAQISIRQTPAAHPQSGKKTRG